MSHKDKSVNVLFALSTVLLIISVANIYFANNAASAISKMTGKSVAAGSAIALQNLKAVSLTIIYNDSCTECFDMRGLADSLKGAGVNIPDILLVKQGTDESELLIGRNNITKLPAMILGNGIASYANIFSALSQVGLRMEQDGYLLQPIQPPFIDLSTGGIAGMIDMIKLTDISCSACYNVSIYDNIFERLGVGIGSEKTYDISSSKGKSIVSKYNITLVPTILVSPEASDYITLSQIWPSIGSKEPDGWYVFRDVRQMGTHRNLITNETINTTLSG